ncbi:MAG: glycosyltransferase family 39 protein, partial [Chloroflexota bacterium]|nr:glycosyltransferase family 39 protein [Chloroflexota bacterium]
MHISYDRRRGGTVPMLDVRERKHIEQIVAKDGLRFAFFVWLAIRIALSLWGWIVSSNTPDETYLHVHETYPGLVLPTDDLHGRTIGIWNIYDTYHYTTIAEKGYAPNPGYLTAFFPGYPLLIRAANLFIKAITQGDDYILAAVLVANLCALGFFWYLYRLVEADYGAEVARRAVILSAIFPTSFFLFIGYTEAPLLAFTVAALYYGRQHKWWLAGILSGAAALTKQPGVFLILPLGYMYWQQYVGYKKSPIFLKKLQWAWLLLCPITAAAYSIYRYLYISAPLKSVTDLGASESISFPGVPLFNALRVARLDNPLLAANLMEIAFTLLMITLVAGCVFMMRSRTYTIYSVALAII